MPPNPERKFVYAPDMEKLREKVEAMKTLLEEATKLYEDLENAEDVGQRLVYLAVAVRDFGRGIIDAEELQERCTMAMAQVDLGSSVELLIGPLRDHTLTPPVLEQTYTTARRRN